MSWHLKLQREMARRVPLELCYIFRQASGSGSGPLCDPSQALPFSESQSPLLQYERGSKT